MLRSVKPLVLLILALCFIQPPGMAQTDTSTSDSLRAEIKQLLSQGRELQYTHSIELIDSAFVLFDSAAALTVRNFGFYDSLHAWSLFKLGENCIYSGDIAARIEFAERMKEIVDSTCSSSLKLRVYCLALLGDTYLEVSDYSRAITVYEEQVALLDDPTVELSSDWAYWLVEGLNDLGRVHEVMGDNPDLVVELFERVLEITEQKLGRDHPRYGVTLANLGWHYKMQRDYERGAQYLWEALPLIEKNYPPQHSNYATNTSFLANCLIMQGEYETADSILRRQMEVIDSTYGESRHPRRSYVIGYQAILFAAQDSLDLALEAAQQMVDLCRSPTRFPTHTYMAAIGRLGKIALAAEEHDLATQIVSELSAARQSFLMNVFKYASESQKLSFVRKYPPIESHLFAGVVQQSQPSTLEAGINMVLRGKGLAVDAMAAEQVTAFCSVDPAMDSLLEEHRLVSDRLAYSVFSSNQTGKGSFLDSLFSVKDRLETELSTACSNLHFFESLDSVSIPSVAASLQPESVLLEFVKYEVCDYNKLYRTTEFDSVYAVITITPSGDHSIVSLGKAEPIDSLVRDYLVGVEHGIHAQSSPEQTEQENRFYAANRALYQHLISPLDLDLGELDEIFVAADGMLNLLPFQTLSVDSERFLVEDIEFVYLSSGRDLLEEVTESISYDAIVMADPDYMVDPSSLPVLASVESSLTLATRGQVNPPECLASMFAPLPMTRMEGSAISDLLSDFSDMDVVYLEGSEARERALKNLQKAPRLLHLATHGYFCPEADRAELSNPLLRSGLILAGANRTIGGMDRETPLAEDGILTALEVSGLNLIGTELVVLSACQTGAGDIQNGEGVFGLRRALQHAGARSIITSMFSVPDESTSKLMSRFYENWLSGQSKSAALRNASMGILKERRQNNDSTHPLFWGGFILIGDPD